MKAEESEQKQENFGRESELGRGNQYMMSAHLCVTCSNMQWARALIENPPPLCPGEDKARVATGAGEWVGKLLRNTARQGEPDLTCRCQDCDQPLDARHAANGQQLKAETTRTKAWTEIRATTTCRWKTSWFESIQANCTRNLNNSAS